MKVEILMRISKSWNRLIISCNQKFFTLKMSWLSWAENYSVLRWEFMMFFLWIFVIVLGLRPILGDVLILFIIFIILIQYPFQNQGFWCLDKFDVKIKRLARLIFYFSFCQRIGEEKKKNKLKHLENRWNWQQLKFEDKVLIWSIIKKDRSEINNVMQNYWKSGGTQIKIFVKCYTIM